MRRPAPAGLRVLTVSAVTAAALAAGGCWGVVPAQAHDQLVAVDPAAGSQLGASPTRVELTFSEAVQARFSKVVVTGPDGQDRAVGPVAVRDAVVGQALAPDGPPGPYTVAYRIVSTDGHPVSGRSVFAVTAASPSPLPPEAQPVTPASPDASAVPPPGPSASDAGPAATGTTAPAAADPQASGSAPSGGAPSDGGQRLATASAGVLALVAVGGWFTLSRRRRVGVRAGR